MRILATHHSACVGMVVCIVAAWGLMPAIYGVHTEQGGQSGGGAHTGGPAVCLRVWSMDQWRCCLHHPGETNSAAVLFTAGLHGPVVRVVTLWCLHVWVEFWHSVAHWCKTVNSRVFAQTPPLLGTPTGEQQELLVPLAPMEGLYRRRCNWIYMYVQLGQELHGFQQLRLHMSGKWWSMVAVQVWGISE